MAHDTRLLLPESYRFYMHPQNHTALDRIATQKAPPPFLSWEELKDFYHAQFSMKRIQYEYCEFLRTAWNLTWGDALQSAKNFTSLPAGDYANNEAPLSPEDVWDDRLVRLYKRGEETWWFGISASTKEKTLYLSWYRGDQQQYDLSAAVQLADEYWEVEHENEESLYRRTKGTLCLLTVTDDSITLEKLRQAAMNVIDLS